MSTNFFPISLTNIPRKFFLILIINLIFYIKKITSSTIGIDLGTEFIKVSILKTNNPFKMVENIQSKTKTPFALAFKDEERLFGSDAISKKVRLPNQVFVNMHEFLGKKYTSKNIKKFIEDFFVSYDIEENKERKTFNFKVLYNNKNLIFSTEEIFGMLFRYIKFLSDKYGDVNVKNCVVTIPAFFGYRERIAISQAIKLSDLNLQSLITENSAAAVQYSLDKEFNKTENIIFYNMGSSYSQATLVSYLSTYENKRNITIEIKKEINVLAEAWEKIGGNNINYNFIKYLMDEFDNLSIRKGKKSIKKDYKVAERILPSVLKYKEILSANKYTPINILGVEDGINLEGKINREKFEEINENIFNKILNPLEKVLEIAKMDISEINQIELLGGSVRIPKIQEIFKNRINPNLIGQHMNGDDSMALGAGFISANFSSKFKAGKKIKFNQGPNYGIKISIENIEEINENFTINYCNDKDSNNKDNDCIIKLNKNEILFPIRTLPDTEKKIEIKYNKDFIIKVFQFFDEENFNNEEIEKDEEKEKENNYLMNIKITGMKEALKYFAENNATSIPNIIINFNMDKKGLINLKSEAVNFNVMYFNQIKKPNGEYEFIYTSEFIEAFDKDKLDEEIKILEADIGLVEKGDLDNKNKIKIKSDLQILKLKREIGKKRTQNYNKELIVNMEYIGIIPLTDDDIKNSRKKLDELDIFDTLRISLMDARNNLESEIYKKNEWLDIEENKKVN
jgi:hypoxia up-regulated 1